MDNQYGNLLKQYLTSPGSYNGSAGFKFALDTGLDGVNRKLAAGGMSGSGNALAELTKYGTGLAMQDYGNTLDRLGKLQGQEQQYDVNQVQNANTAQRNAWDYDLGQTQNALKGQNDWWNYNLGQTQNANTAANNQNNFNLGVQRNNVDWFNAGTNRGNAQSGDYYRGQDSARQWEQLYRGGR